MANYFIYAKDYSQSTDGVPFYHRNGLKTLQDFKSDIDKTNIALSQTGQSTPETRTIYLHWGHECVEVDERTLINEYRDEIAYGKNTLPEKIIEWLQENIDLKNGNIKLMYIITDGLIGSNSVKKCLELNEHIHYETVVFHALHEDLDEIDLSVASSFLKSHCVIYRNCELLDDTNIAVEFNYDGIKLENFDTEKNNLKSYIRLKYINTSKSNKAALKEIDNLKKLRDRLFNELSLVQGDKPNLNTRDKNEFIHEFMKTAWYRNLNNLTHYSKVDIEKSISTLINYIINDTKSYSFDALKFETTFKNEVAEEPIVDVNFPAEQEIEFPDIILDDDKGIPVVLLAEINLLNKIIFHASDSDEVLPASFSKFKSAMECPLFLINDPDISESIGHFYTLNVYKELLKEEETKRDPLTRKSFHGGLVLLDTDEFDRYNDYILAATYFNFKKVKYNIGLFYYVLWKNCEKKEWMDKNVVEQFKKYVMRRISKSVCRIGLSSLPLDPPENTSLLTALWYCVELSSCIFKDDPRNFMHERLRMYYGVAFCMIEILKYFNYNLDLGNINKRRDLIRHVMILKKIPTHKERVYFLLEKIFKSVNGFLVCEIENPSNLQKLNYLKLNHKNMLCDNVIEEKVHLSEFVHLMYYVHDNRNRIMLCSKTYRPFFTIGQNNSFYTELLNIAKKVVIKNDDNSDNVEINYEAIDCLEFCRILSEYKHFINCVQDLNRYPTFSEYVEYVSKKKKFNDELITIFSPNVYEALQEAFESYQNLINEVNVNVFIKVCNNCVKRMERIKLEKVRKFDSDREIAKFLSDQEAKVNLKKRKC